MDGALTRKVRGQHTLRMPGFRIFLSAGLTVGNQSARRFLANRTSA